MENIILKCYNLKHNEKISGVNKSNKKKSEMIK